MSSSSNLSTRKNTYPENCRVFVGNLDHSATDKEELRKIFSPYGELAEEVHLHKYFYLI
jgi:RNA recognition motif-containing protein